MHDMCGRGEEDGLEWTGRVRDAVTLIQWTVVAAAAAAGVSPASSLCDTL